MSWQVMPGDCLEVMKGMEENSIDAIVTDPPYGLSFMGKDWDHGIPGEHFWIEALRVAKPGCHLLAFSGTRTFHRLTCAIEDAGWEIRDCIMWLYGSGFPKSMDISKAIDKAAGAEREIISTIKKTPSAASKNMNEGWRRPWAEIKGKTMDITAPTTDAARQWQGWGTALKPAWEPIIVARKPVCGTVAENVLRYGTGGINVDGCRIGNECLTYSGMRQHLEPRPWSTKQQNGESPKPEPKTVVGRFPANLILDEEAGRMLDEQSGISQSSNRPRNNSSFGNPNGGNCYGGYSAHVSHGFIDAGGASRFFYCAKASREDRNEGLEGMEGKHASHDGRDKHIENPYQRHDNIQTNHHPTVKPTSLMQYLCRLITPPDGVVLDPFCGSGSTGKAAIKEGFHFIGIELDPEYCQIAEARLAAAHNELPLFANDQPLFRQEDTI